MAAPSNIRINPFIGDGGTTNYVNFIEKHIVPAVSPFVIRLNEVPEKQDPSNIKVGYIDGNVTGEPTGVTLTEVAATPGAGEYRLDYSTNAVGDKEWNTDLIEFSSSDATNVVQISYTGTGTLAGVKNNRFPSWWLDRGDSSDGDFVPTGNTTISGVKQYRSVIIRSGVTVTISGYAIIKCQGVFINHGTITASGQGAHGGSGGYYAKDDATGKYYPSAAGAGASAISGVGGAGGSNHGAAGAGGGCTAFNVPLNGPSVIELTMSLRGFGFGAGGGGGGCGLNNISRYGGGAGGRGGGAIAIVSTSIYNSGIIAANGANGYSTGNDKGSGGGGGGGGMVAMIADTIMNYGSVTAAGGAGGSGRTSGAAGGTGIVFIKELGVM